MDPFLWRLPESDNWGIGDKLKKAIKIGFAGVIALVGIAAGGSVANADNGDGAAACAAGEICFTNVQSGFDLSSAGKRQFYYGATHGGLVWGAGTASGTQFQDRVKSFWNRDQIGTVNLVNYAGGVKYSITLSRQPIWYALYPYGGSGGASWSEVNDAHELF